MAARKWPSASVATVRVASSWRAWLAAIRFSRRSSIHFTGRPTCLAASSHGRSSRVGYIFWPKPPPTSPNSTRTRFSGTPKTRAANALISCGLCVDGQTRQLAGVTVP